MNRSVIILSLSALLIFNRQDVFAQPGGTRQLDPKVAAFLKMIGNQDLSIEQLQQIPIEKKNTVRVWEKCFAGQIHLFFGLPPNAEEIKEFEAIIKTARKECFDH